jgi:mannan endo-1,4-beta-mannosidase
VRARRLLPAVICVLALAGCGQPGFGGGQPGFGGGSPEATRPPAGPTRPSGPPSEPPRPLATAPGSYLGVFEPGAPRSYGPVSQFAASAGRPPNLALYFSGTRQPFALAFARQARAHGAVPLIQMQPLRASMAKIAAGQLDGYLRSYADAVRAYGHPVVIGFAHEMNGNWYPWGYQNASPATWVAAWRHVVTVFRGQGAGNVTWMWTVNVIGSGGPPLRSYWPGSNYVTWIGIDGYLAEPRATFSTVLGPTVAAVRAFSSAPVLLAETAVGPESGPVAKIPGLFAGIREDHLLGLVWFDAAQNDGLYHQDWRLEDDPAALAEFRRAAAALPVVQPADQP